MSNGFSAFIVRNSIFGDNVIMIKTVQHKASLLPGHFCSRKSFLPVPNASCYALRSSFFIPVNRAKTNAGKNSSRHEIYAMGYL